MSQIEKLLSELKVGSLPALSRAISILEEGAEPARALIGPIFRATTGVRVIGITGAPGAGKSTLTDKLALHFSEQGKRVAILAVDPSSPFTGGALLGDRIRMVGASERKGIFIRSMASRGAAGGLAPRTKEVIYAFDAAGFDLVLVETVGVGQGEIEIVRNSDSVVVVLVPGMGDGVQALKAGVLEIADLFAINKADYEGVERLERELRTVLGLNESQGWTPRIVRTVAPTGEGVLGLAAELDAHWSWMTESGELAQRRERFLQEYLREASLELIANRAGSDEKFLARLSELATALGKRETDPLSAVSALSDLVFKSNRGSGRRASRT